MLDAGGNCNTTISTQCCVAWGKFGNCYSCSHSTTSRPSYEACISSAMLHSSEMWGPNASNLLHLQHNDHSMIHWICGISEHDEVSSDQLLVKLGLRDVTAILCSRRLCWFSHVQWGTRCIKRIADFTAPGSRGRGQPRKVWAECIHNDTVSNGSWIIWRTAR